MIKYIGNGWQNVIKRGEKIDITMPSPIATVNFNACSVGTYIVEVDENGNWTSRYCFWPN